MPPKNPTTNGEKSEPIKNTVPQKSVHTYASDLADVIKSGQASVAKIAIAEADKKRQTLENKNPISKKNLIFIIGSVLLILIALGLVGWSIYKTTIKTVPIEGEKFDVTPLVRIDTQKGIDITGLTNIQLRDQLTNIFKKSAPKLNTVEQTYFYEKSIGASSLTKPTAFFQKLGWKIPDTVSRTLGDNWVFGIHAFTGNGPFMLFQTNSYATTFTGMLAWEQTLFDEFYVPFGIDVAGEKNYLFNAPFRDVVLQNQDARAILDKSGKPVFFYTFIGEEKSLLFIGTKETTLKEVVNRLTAVKMKR